jgi:hypothetical protein
VPGRRGGAPAAPYAAGAARLCRGGCGEAMPLPLLLLPPPPLPLLLLLLRFA